MMHTTPDVASQTLCSLAFLRLEHIFWSRLFFGGNTLSEGDFYPQEGIWLVYLYLYSNQCYMLQEKKNNYVTYTPNAVL